MIVYSKRECFTAPSASRIAFVSCGGALGLSSNLGSTGHYCQKMVKQYVSNCHVCQQHKSTTQAPAGLLQPLPFPEQVWEDISMDFITHLPSSHGKTVIWVIVDRLTKFAHFLALPSNYTAQSLATLFSTEIYKLHSLPRAIVSDRDPLFLSQFWKAFFSEQKTTLSYSSAYHPQSDGQTEVLNRCLEAYLRCFVSDEPQKWCQFLHLGELWYNTSFHSSINMTPFEALYGRKPPSIPPYNSGSTKIAALDEMLHQR